MIIIRILKKNNCKLSNFHNLQWRFSTTILELNRKGATLPQLARWQANRRIWPERTFDIWNWARRIDARPFREDRRPWRRIKLMKKSFKEKLDIVSKRNLLFKFSTESIFYPIPRRIRKSIRYKIRRKWYNLLRTRYINKRKKHRRFMKYNRKNNYQDINLFKETKIDIELKEAYQKRFLERYWSIAPDLPRAPKEQGIFTPEWIFKLEASNYWWPRNRMRKTGVKCFCYFSLTKKEYASYDYNSYTYEKEHFKKPKSSKRKTKRTWNSIARTEPLSIEEPVLYNRSTFLVYICCKCCLP